ncbi:acetyl-CoA synthetase-like protein [Morchella conica CCBAS932]|uniref:Acetyl-CoA synthetase-like protein n=1 Tax=Morchella conica CCBAS932 TaxID=1392247 RepID=A0A3N4L6Y4_9PEZI|nr:acetyl-CoA synthetase-like protein [Morchella conica CCBAS932]
MSFRRPNFELLHPLAATKNDNIRTFPELLAFNAKHNGSSLFCLQGVKDSSEPPVPVTFEQLQKAVDRCKAWLTSNVAGIELPKVDADGRVTKSPAVGILMGSDVGIIIYMMALLALGVPVVLLSARLTPVAIAHLLKATSAGAVLVSARCTRAATDALSSYDEGEKPPTVYEPISYERYLDDSDPIGWASLEVPSTYNVVDEMDRNVVIMHSSGTTGLPKPIYHPHKYLLGYANNHLFGPEEKVDGVSCSTLPLFHGFGLLAISLSLSIGKPFCIPAASVIPTATSTLALIRSCNARSLMSVPSILEDIEKLPNNEGLDVLKQLDYVVVGGGPIKSGNAEALVAAGVKLLNHMGCTEIGAIAPIFIPGPDYDWHYIQLRKDIGLRVEPAEDGLFKLIGYPFGWGVEFPVSDLLQCNPLQPETQFRVLGRADDLLVLATGEKILPRMMESTVSNDSKVKDAIAFGDGRFNIGLIVEANIEIDPTDEAQVKSYIDSIWPSVEAGNEFTDAHGKITSKSMIVVTAPSYKPLARTDKGSLIRKTIVKDFTDKIEEAYKKSEHEGIEAMPPAGQTEDIRTWLRNMVERGLNLGNDDEWTDQDDFFELGMDSLQATVLRRKIVAGMNKSGGDGDSLQPDLIFAYPTIEKMVGILAGKAVVAVDREDRVKNMAQKYINIVNSLDSNSGAVVLITGSTGSLGAFLLAQLSGLPNVSKVICLNRRTGAAIRDFSLRQQKALERGGIEIPKSHWEKITVHEVDLKSAQFGLSSADYNSLKSVTHIIHNAWPMDFNRSLESFEPHFQGTKNIIELALAANTLRPENVPRILFTSSVAVVGRYPSLNGTPLIPEIPMPDPSVTDHFGYPEAKWVCEQMLEEAGRTYAGRVETIITRVGQLTGSESSGAWSPKEHFPSILKSSQTIGSLPAVQGTLSWIPVDRAAKVVIELLLQPTKPAPVYHLENPMRQPWMDILTLLSRALDLKSSEEGKPAVIPFDQWLDKVRSIDDYEKNPAGNVVKFLEEEFTSMASGAVILDTQKARGASDTLANSGGIEKKHIDLYVNYWRSIGHLG